jgi:hypothetical protein
MSFKYIRKNCLGTLKPYMKVLVIRIRIVYFLMIEVVGIDLEWQMGRAG